MNRNLFLILSALMVFVLLGIWVYLVFFNNQTAEPVDQAPIEGSGAAGDFSFGDDTFGGTDPSLENENNNQGLPEGQAYDPDILRQLTTRNVIGFKEVVVASTTYVYYMESGVGHIYGINLTDGIEERISATTIPNAREAAFSSDGTFAIVKTGDSNGVNPISFVTIDRETSSSEVTPFAEMVDEFTVAADGLVLFATKNNSSMTAQSYNLETKATNTLFTVPFREAIIEWGSVAAGPHYFYPKTSYSLEGFLYRVVDGNLTRTAHDGFGFTANGWENIIVSTSHSESRMSTKIENIEVGETFTSQTVIIPEKCVSHEDALYCAQDPSTRMQTETLDSWYKGTINFSDSLWKIMEPPQPLIDITAFSGRSVDVADGALGSESTDWYFTNKIDNSLWVYELSRMLELE